MRTLVTRQTPNGTYYHTSKGLEFIPAGCDYIPASYGRPRHVTVARLPFWLALGSLGAAVLLGLAVGRWVL